jgi:hypothetical protein
VNPVRSFFKALLFAFLAGWILFFLGVFMGLVALAIYGQVRGSQPDYAMAYKAFGAPMAALGMLMTFFGSIVRDLRRHPHNSD